MLSDASGQVFTYLSVELGVSDFLEIWKRSDHKDSIFIQGTGCETANNPVLEIPLSLLKQPAEQTITIESSVADIGCAKGLGVLLLIVLDTKRKLKVWLYLDDMKRPKRPWMFRFRSSKTRRAHWEAEARYDFFHERRQQQMTNAELAGKKVVKFLISEWNTYNTTVSN